MLRKLFMPTIVAVALTTLSCAAFVAGTGAGVGAYTYVKGELQRSYQAPFDATVDACTAALSSLDIALLERKAGGMQTTLIGQRADGTPITVSVEMTAVNITAVGVRSGVVGYWDRNLSEMIHASIAQKLP
jgi:hypothetical protein